MIQLLTLRVNNAAPQSPFSRVKPLEAFGACAEGSSDLDDIGKFVPAVTSMTSAALADELPETMAAISASMWKANTLIMQEASGRAM